MYFHYAAVFLQQSSVLKMALEIVRSNCVFFFFHFPVYISNCNLVYPLYEQQFMVLYGINIFQALISEELSNDAVLGTMTER